MNSLGYGVIFYPKNFYLPGKIYKKMGDTKSAIVNCNKFLDLWENADENLPELIDAKVQLVKLKRRHPYELRKMNLEETLRSAELLRSHRKKPNAYVLGLYIQTFQGFIYSKHISISSSKIKKVTS